jgi:predicted RNA-binding protein YlxR (DUF448 family)
MNSKANTNKQSVGSRKVPQRSCIACRRAQDKKGLIRLVCHEDKVTIDPGGKKAGRGAYLCPVFECWEQGLQKKRLEYALRTTLRAEDSEALWNFAQSLPRKAESED